MNKFSLTNYLALAPPSLAVIGSDEYRRQFGHWGYFAILCMAVAFGFWLWLGTKDRRRPRTAREAVRPEDWKGWAGYFVLAAGIFLIYSKKIDGAAAVSILAVGAGLLSTGANGGPPAPPTHTNIP
jgi:hypothetical protein